MIARLFGAALFSAALFICDANADSAPPELMPAPVAACLAGKTMDIAGGHIHFSFAAEDFSVGRVPICNWVYRSAQAVSHYFGRFPVGNLRLILKSAEPSVVETGTTWGESKYAEPLIVVVLGRRASTEVLRDDWVMTHEMTHLAVPSLPERNHWFEEGVATYVEPIARAQLGHLTAERVWSDMLKGMPNGLPAVGDRGLDQTPTWGRTYWGGALFCLLADVEIRKRTNNAKSLRDALRGVLAAGGTIEKDWPIERVFAAGDAAIGVPVLVELYRQMATAPGLAELAPLWQQLGVERSSGGVRFMEQAPLAAVRAGITAEPERQNRDADALGH